MKLQELFENEFTPNAKQLNETRPYGFGQQMKDKALGSLKGIFGGGQGEAGNQSAGDIANRMFNDFKHYVGTQGQAGKELIDKQLLTDYLRGRGLNPSLANELPDLIKPKEAAEVIMKAARGKRQLGQAKTFDQGQSQDGNPNYDKGSTNQTTDNNELMTVLKALKGLSSKDVSNLINMIHLAQGNRQ